MAERRLDYCAVASLVGRKGADKLFGRELPPGFDVDQRGDEEMVTAIVLESEDCYECGECDA